MSKYNEETKNLDKFEKEKLVITKIGTGCNFPGCEKVSGYKIKFLEEIFYLCAGHKKYLQKKLELEFVEVDSRTFNKIPPKFKKYLESEEGLKYLKNRWIASPITGKTFRMRKPNKKQREGIILGHIISDMKIRSREITEKTKIIVVEPFEQKTHSEIMEEKND